MITTALAGDLGLPLVSTRLDWLMTKYMGLTAAKLRVVFDAIQSTRGVYLFAPVRRPRQHEETAA
jgi:hypothetical protein